MTDGHCFISYSTADAKEFARRLADELQGGEDTFTKTWFDKRDIDPAHDWDDQIVDGIRSCKCMLFVMTKDSTSPGSMCKNEWNWALKYKKPVVPIRLGKDAEQPFGLGNRQWIDFTGEFEHGLSKLRLYLREMDSPTGILQALKDRHADAERDLRRANPEDQIRIQAEIEELNKQIEIQQKIVDNPKAAEEQTQKNILTGLERERQPEKPVTAKSSMKFINTPPGIAPDYFQDRYFETEQIVDFLKKDAQRLMTIVGRGGIGKTATICRLLKDLERGVLPDNLGEMKVDGIVYLSEVGSHKINFANIFYDLCKLLPAEIAQELDTVYKNPQGSPESKMHALLDRFHGERVVLLLDNFESLINDEFENFPLRDSELDETLHALLNGAHTSVKVIITTRVPPHALNFIQPGRQRIHNLEKGLEPKYAEEMLRQMDAEGMVGLKNANNTLLQGAYERTRGFPKAIEALYQILASDRYTTLAELLAMPTPDDVVEALVGEAFNRLDPSAQKVMQALAVYNRPVSPAAIDYLLQPHLPSIDSALVLNRLVNMHFARREAGRYYLHPADKEYAFGLIPEGKIKEERNESDELSFTQHELLTRAADYFAQARKPRAEWKKLEDLSAQLAEFDLRCAAGDYDTAASVLLEIDYDYLYLWGHYRLMIELHEKLQGKVTDKNLARQSVGNLGTTYSQIGKIEDSIEYTKQALEMARNEKNRSAEGVWLCNLGNRYIMLGDTRKAIEFLEQALTIARESGTRKDEGISLGNIAIVEFNSGNSQKAIEYLEMALEIDREIGHRVGEETRILNLAEAYIDVGDFDKAIESCKKSLEIALEISIPAIYEYSYLSLVHLLRNDLPNARSEIEKALQYDVPEYNHNASALHGIIALRQRGEVTARGAFVRAIGQADEILSKTAEYYSALDAKGLALCGLAICDLRLGRGAVPGPEDAPVNTTGRGDPAPTINDAIETFRKARKIAPHAGVVKSVLRLFDELAKCDEAGILKDVRSAVEGA